MALHSARGKLIGVIGDEDTCVGRFFYGIMKKLQSWALPVSFHFFTNNK